MEPLANCIYEGRQIECSLSQRLNDILVRNVARVKPVSGKDYNSSSVFERIGRAKETFDQEVIQALLAPYANYFQKSAQLSVLLREKGNALYKSKNVEGALRAYTLALAFAPTTMDDSCINEREIKKKELHGEEMMLAYTNRSAVLLQKGNWKAALEDIDRALAVIDRTAVSIPNLKEKLNERKLKCGELARKVTTIDKGEGGGKVQEFKEIREKLFTITAPSTNIPSAESFVKIKYSPERGRYLKVTTEVAAGSVLFVDKPFVSTLNDLLRWETGHCHHCSRGMVNGIPCLECSFALFCSEECRDSACRVTPDSSSCGGIHHLEHKYLPILHCLDAPHGDIQCLRIFAVASKEAIQLAANEELGKPSGSGSGFDKDGVYNAHSYLPIFHLISHPPVTASDSEDDREALQTAMKALLFKEILKMFTNYFNGSNTDAFQDMVASLMLKHLESIKYNAISLSKLVTSADEANGTVATASSVAYAAAVYPLISLCNHSCDANCVPVKQSHHLVTSLVAMKHLRAGEELTITYKPVYTHMKTGDRQRFLAESYRFICSCEACENNWGPGTIALPQQLGKKSGFQEGALLILEPSRCDKCGWSGSTETANSQYAHLASDKQCHDCVLKDVNRARMIQKMEGILFECHDLLLGKGDEGDQSIILKCLERLSEVVDCFGKEGFRSYFPLYNIALDLLKRTLVRGVAQM